MGLQMQAERIYQDMKGRVAPSRYSYAGKSIAKSARDDIMESDLGVFKEKLRSDDKIDKEYYSTLKEKFSHGSDAAKAAFSKYVSNDSVEDAMYEGIANYNPKTKKIMLHYGADSRNERGSGTTWFHEHGHLIDDAAGRISDDDIFRKLLQRDVADYRFSYSKQSGLKMFCDIDNAISAELNSMREHSGVSDMLSGITQGTIKGIAGHSKEYWKNKSHISSEAFAHMYEAQFDSIRYKEMKKYFPNSLEYFENKLKEIVK
jgi:hypothetical protein